MLIKAISFKKKRSLKNKERRTRDSIFNDVIFFYLKSNPLQHFVYLKHPNFYPFFLNF